MKRFILASLINLSFIACNAQEIAQAEEAASSKETYKVMLNLWVSPIRKENYGSIQFSHQSLTFQKERNTGNENLKSIIKEFDALSAKMINNQGENPCSELSIVFFEVDSSTPKGVVDSSKTILPAVTSPTTEASRVFKIVEKTDCKFLPSAITAQLKKGWARGEPITAQVQIITLTLEKETENGPVLIADPKVIWWADMPSRIEKD